MRLSMISVGILGKMHEDDPRGSLNSIVRCPECLW